MREQASVYDRLQLFVDNGTLVNELRSCTVTASWKAAVRHKRCLHYHTCRPTAYMYVVHVRRTYPVRRTL